MCPEARSSDPLCDPRHGCSTGRGSRRCAGRRGSGTQTLRRHNCQLFGASSTGVDPFRDPGESATAIEIGTDRRCDDDGPSVAARRGHDAVGQLDGIRVGHCIASVCTVSEGTASVGTDADGASEGRVASGCATAATCGTIDVSSAFRRGRGLPAAGDSTAGASAADGNTADVSTLVARDAAAAEGRCIGAASPGTQAFVTRAAAVAAGGTHGGIGH